MCVVARPGTCSFRALSQDGQRAPALFRSVATGRPHPRQGRRTPSDGLFISPLPSPSPVPATALARLLGAFLGLQMGPPLPGEDE